MLEVEAKNWYRDNYLVSTESKLIDVDAVHDALSSDLTWWSQSLPKDSVKTAVRNSLCLGLYVLPQSTADIAGQSSPTQVGLVRVVTDDVTFAYMTDVYVLPEYQGKGLGRWMMECLNEIIKGWPHLRRFMTAATNTMDLYRNTLGVKEWDEIKPEGVKLGVVEGPAAKRHH